MDKRTLLALLLASLVFIGWMVINNTYFSNPVPNQELQPTKTIKTVDEKTTPVDDKSEQVAANTETEKRFKIIPIEKESLSELEKVIETKKFKLVFTSKGALLKSALLKDYKESTGENIDMIISKNSGKYPFGITFGDFNTDNIVFQYKLNSQSIEFFKDFKYIENEVEYLFTLKKTFLFSSDQYVIDVKIQIESPKNESLKLDFNNVMYTLVFGPQIGPSFKKLGTLAQNMEYRISTYYTDGKRQDFSASVIKKQNAINKVVSWVAIEGKYFLAIAYPPPSLLQPKAIGFDNRPIDTFSDVNQITFSKPFQRTSVIEDNYKFYLGPKKKDFLNQYKDISFDKVIPNDIWLGWLVEILKYLLIFLQKFVQNWGIAIILMTLITKIILFPLTQASLKSNAKMQALGPKMAAIREKLKSNPEKMNVELADLYKKEGINPLSGCLPLLIQMPFFFALYNLFNSHFELRGAFFIPGWINDLSAPESIFTLPFSIPFIGEEIRLLPFIMLGSSFLQMVFTPTQSSSTDKTMKYLIYILPFVFFFGMYNTPSGLVLYWTMTNFFSVIQQVYTNKMLKVQAEKAASNKPENVNFKIRSKK